MLTLERIQELQSGDVDLKGRILLHFGNEYDTCDHTFNVTDYEFACKEYETLYGQYFDTVTGFVLKVTEGDIDELWVTDSSIPYDLQCEYYRLF
jgi:hypothetical protein